MTNCGREFSDSLAVCPSCRQHVTTQHEALARRSADEAPHVETPSQMSSLSITQSVVFSNREGRLRYRLPVRDKKVVKRHQLPREKRKSRVKRPQPTQKCILQQSPGDTQARGEGLTLALGTPGSNEGIVRCRQQDKLTEKR